jgi:hypothetical protein
MNMPNCSRKFRKSKTKDFTLTFGENEARLRTKAGMDRSPATFLCIHITIKFMFRNVFNGNIKIQCENEIIDFLFDCRLLVKINRRERF